MKKRIRFFAGSLAAAVCLAGFTIVAPVRAAGIAVQAAASGSNVAYEGYDRDQVLQVDGQPFFYNGVQIRIDKVRDAYNYTPAQVKNMFQVAKDDGFTVANVQIAWTDVQPDTFIKANAADIATVQQKNPDTASPNVFQLSDMSGDRRLSYLRFNIQELQGTEAAKIRVYLKQAASYSHSIHVYGLSDDSWDASKLTWNSSLPGLNAGKNITAAELGSTASWDPVKSANYYDIDVSKFVAAAQKSGKHTVSFLVESQTAGASAEALTLGDADSGEIPPRLVVSENKSKYAWDYLDTIIGDAAAAGIKMEILWFGTDTTGISTDTRLPYYVLNNYQKSLKSDKTPFFTKASYDTLTGVYNYLMSKNDTNLQAQEGAALKALFNHVATLRDADTVVGCQVANEPAVGKLHGSYVADYDYSDIALQQQKEQGLTDAQQFRDWTMWTYLNNLAAAVKGSDHPVWTRVNNYMGTDATTVNYNENKRATTGTNLDFVGLDPYRKSISFLYGLGHTNSGSDFNIYSKGQNLPMVMEDGGSYDSASNYGPSQSLTLATLAGGAFYNVYDLCSPDGYGLYDNTAGNVMVPHGAYVEDVKQTNLMLKKIGYDLATKKPDSDGGTMLDYFNGLVEGTKNETKKICGINVNYTTDNGGVGIAVDKGANEIALESTAASTFTLKGLAGKIASVETGSYDDPSTDTPENVWAGDGSLTYTENGSDIVIRMPAYSCVRVLTKDAVPSANLTESTVKYELENVPYALSPNTRNEFWDDSASAGGWLKFFPASDNTGSITFKIDVPAGVAKANIVICYRTGTTRGSAALSVDGADAGLEINMKASSSAYKETAPVQVDLEPGQRNAFTFTETAAGDLGFDYLKLTPVLMVDNSSLSDAIQNAQTLKGSDYTPDSWQALQAALKDARDIAAAPTATQGQVDAAAAALEKAQENLALKPVVTGVTVTPRTVSVETGKTQRFSAAVAGENAPAQMVAWNVSGSRSGGTVISGDGVLTVASDETATALTVTATSTEDTDQSGTASVTVTTPAPPATLSNPTAAATSAALTAGGNNASSSDTTSAGNPATGGVQGNAGWVTLAVIVSAMGLAVLMITRMKARRN